MTMSAAKACAYFFCFTAFKFLLCIYQFYFWFVVFFDSTYNYLGRQTNLMLQAFAKPDFALAQQYQVQPLPRPHWEQPSFFLSFTVAALHVVLSSITKAALLKKNSFISNPPFCYSSLLTFLLFITIPHYILTKSF